jgi:hypothetical protein
MNSHSLKNAELAPIRVTFGSAAAATASDSARIFWRSRVIQNTSAQ